MIFERRLRILAQTAELSGDLALHLLGGTFRAEVTNALDFRSPEHVLFLELAADEGEVAYAIPSPARRESKSWVLDTIPLMPGK